MFIVFDKIHCVPKSMPVICRLGCRQGCCLGHYWVSCCLMARSKVFPTSTSVSRSLWKEQNLKMSFPDFHGLCGFLVSQQVWFIFLFTLGNSLSQTAPAGSDAGEAAHCQPLLCLSRDRGDRGDEELREAGEAPKAKKQQREPNSLVAELIKRKEKLRQKKRRKKNVYSHLNSVWNCVTKPDSNTYFSYLDEDDSQQVDTDLHIRKEVLKSQKISDHPNFRQNKNPFISFIIT